jgi:hypothetical protein
VGPATTAVGPLLALPVDGRGGLQFSCHQYPGGRIIPTAPLECLVLGSRIATERSCCIRELSYWILAAVGMVKSVRSSVEGSTEWKVEKDLLVETSNLTTRKSNWKME